MDLDVNELMGRLDDAESENLALRSRLRVLEARLQDRALTVSNQKGQYKRIRLAADGETLEVE